MEHSFNFFCECISCYIGKYPQTVLFLSFFFSWFKTPFLSTTKSCMCVKSDTKQKAPPCSTELGLRDGISGNTWYPVRVELRSDQPQPLPWPATTISSPFLHFYSNLQWELSLAGFVPLVSWLSVSCSPTQEVKCSHSIGCLELQYLSIGGNLVFFFACVKKKGPLLLMKRVRGQHLLNHSSNPPTS